MGQTKLTIDRVKDSASRIHHKDVLLLPDGIGLRDAKKTDIDQLFEWELETISKNLRDKDGIRKKLRQDTLDNIKHVKVIVDFTKSKDIGMYEAYAIDDGKWWYLDEIYLIPEYRGKGIGSTLIKRDIASHDKLVLRVDSENKKAIKLYKSLGFEITERHENSYVMRLDQTKTTQESFMDEYKSEIFESGDFDKYRNVDKVMLRPATDDDINFIYDCEIETVEADKRNDDTTKREVLQDSKDSVGHTKIIFIDHNPDKRIGIYQGYATNEYGLKEGTRDWWYLAEIYIIPEFRNKGIGSAIIKAEIEKHDKIMLNVLDENTKAQRLYESLGFKTTQTYEGHKIMRLVKGETYTEDADIGTMLKVALAANAVKNDDINAAATLSKYTAIPFNRASFEQYREGHGQTQMDMSHLVVRDDKMSGMIYVDKSDMIVCFFVMEQRPDGTKIIISMGTGIDMRMQGLVTCMLKVAQTDYHANLFILNKKYAELIKCVLNSGWTIKNQKPNMVLLEGPAQSNVKTEMYTESYMFTESVHENKKLVFHVSPDAHLDGRVFTPRVPSYLGDYDPDDKNFENSTTPRVCFSTSVDGAINAIIVNMNRQQPNQFDRFYVYIPEKPVGDYKHKTNKEIIRDHDVFDANSTKELWIMEPVRLKLYGAIRIDQVKNVKRVKTVPTQSGKTDTRPYYKYKWHWLIKPKVLDKTPYHYDTMTVCERLEMDIGRLRYGLLVDGHLNTKATDVDFNRDWTFHSADEVDRAGGGNCFDFVEYEAHYLESYGVSYKKYFFTATTDDNKLIGTHTIVVVPHDGKFVYIEGAFKRVVDDMGNLRTFDKLDDIFEYVAECLADYENRNINYGVFDYTDETFKKGTPIQNFIDYIITNCDMVHDGHASKPKSNKTKKE